MFRTRSVLPVLMVISYVIQGASQGADADRAQLVCGLRWNRGAAQAQPDQCVEGLIGRLKEQRRLVAYLVSYAGRRARSNEARGTANDFRRYLIDHKGVRDRQLVSVDGGFREEPWVEIFLAPLGSEIPRAAPTIDPDVVDFVDDIPTEGPTVRLTNSKLLKSALDKPEPVYPPLARAARVEGDVGVKVLIDDQGSVKAARVVDAHPLLSDSAQNAALRWRFVPPRSASTPVKGIGLLIFHFVLSSTKPDLIQTG